MGLMAATSGPGDSCAFQENQCSPGYVSAAPHTAHTRPQEPCRIDS